MSGGPGFIVALADSAVLYYKTHGWTLLRLRFDLQDSPWTSWLVRKFGKDRDPGWPHEPAIFKYRAKQFHVYWVWPPNTWLGLKMSSQLKNNGHILLKNPYTYYRTEILRHSADIMVRVLEMSACLTLKQLQKDCRKCLAFICHCWKSCIPQKGQLLRRQEVALFERSDNALFFRRLPFILSVHISQLLLWRIVKSVAREAQVQVLWWKKDDQAVFPVVCSSWTHCSLSLLIYIILTTW